MCILAANRSPRAGYGNRTINIPRLTYVISSLLFLGPLAAAGALCLWLGSLSGVELWGAAENLMSCRVQGEIVYLTPAECADVWLLEQRSSD